MVLAGSSAPLQSIAPAPRGGPRAEQLRQRLVHLLRETRSASWIQTTWERKGDEEQLVRSRCLWRADGILRVDVEEGKGAGAKILRRGDEVVIRPPGLFGMFKLHRPVDDDMLRSLRGRDMRQAGFFADLERVVREWGQVDVSFDGEDAELRYSNADHLSARMVVRLVPLAPVVIEARDEGELVERTIFSDVRFGVPVNPDALEP